MRSKILIVIAALVLGGMAAVLAANYLQSARSEIAGQGQPVEVLVAQEDLPRGLAVEALISKGLVKVEKVPAQFVAADAVSSERVIADQVLSSSISAGEQLTKSRFEYPAAAGLAYSVPDDFVAVTVRVDEVGGVAGLLKPGDNVVVFTNHQPESKSTAFTRTEVTKARVLAIGANTSAEGTPSNAGETQGGGVLARDGSGSNTAATDEKAYTTVTLALGMDDAQRVVFGTQFGVVQLALLPQNAPAPSAPSADSYLNIAPKALLDLGSR